VSGKNNYRKSWSTTTIEWDRLGCFPMSIICKLENSHLKENQKRLGDSCWSTLLWFNAKIGSEEGNFDIKNLWSTYALRNMWFETSHILWRIVSNSEQRRSRKAKLGKESMPLKKKKRERILYENNLCDQLSAFWESNPMRFRTKARNKLGLTWIEK